MLATARGAQGLLLLRIIYLHLSIATVCHYYCPDEKGEPTVSLSSSVDKRGACTAAGDISGERSCPIFGGVAGGALELPSPPSVGSSRIEYSRSNSLATFSSRNPQNSTPGTKMRRFGASSLHSSFQMSCGPMSCNIAGKAPSVSDLAEFL